MSDNITHDLDLLDDWLAGKGYGEEAGLVLRALSLIHKQARENEKLRAALKPFAEQYDAVEKEFGLLMLPDDANSIVRYADLRAAAAALKEMGDE